jgi:hypothetical protein
MKLEGDQQEIGTDLLSRLQKLRRLGVEIGNGVHWRDAANRKAVEPKRASVSDRANKSLWAAR